MALFADDNFKLWYLEGLGISGDALGIYNEIRALVAAKCAPKAETVTDAFARLEQVEDRRRAFQNKWSRVAPRESRRGGTYSILCVGSSLLAVAAQLYWAGYVINELSAQSGADALRLAEGLADVSRGNIAGVQTFNGKMKPAEGQAWAAVHLPLILSPLVGSGLSLATELGGMPAI